MERVALKSLMIGFLFSLPWTGTRLSAQTGASPSQANRTKSSTNRIADDYFSTVLTVTPEFGTSEGIEGAHHGEGKSTVAKGLATLRGSTLLLEDFESDPFLRAFYEYPVGNATETEFAGTADGALRGKLEGWLFPSPKAVCGHLTTVAKQFRKARLEAGLPSALVLYCARHTFGTAAYEATGNLAMVMKAMGHADVRTSMQYQHPGLDSIREAINQRNLRHKPRHTELRVQ